MKKLAAGELPTIADLVEAGTDAGALIDATRWELERAIGSTRDKATKQAIAEQIKALDKLQANYFRGDA